jgi:hypothetical protein
MAAQPAGKLFLCFFRRFFSNFGLFVALYTENNEKSKRSFVFSIGSLPPAIMARVDSCAYLFGRERPEKVGKIVQERGVSAPEAARIYTIGVLKASKRRGTARNYREALDRLEAEQVGDRGDPLTRTVSADATARTIARICRDRLLGYYDTEVKYSVTGRCNRQGKPMFRYAGTVSRYVCQDTDSANIPDYYTYRPSYTTHVDGVSVYGPAIAVGEHYSDDKPAHTARSKRSTGRVLGTLYAQYEERQERQGPEHEFTNTTIEGNLRRYFTEYESHLSNTVHVRLRELFAYITAHIRGDKGKIEGVVRALMSVNGRKDPATSRLARFVDNLHKAFPHRDSITGAEFAELLYRYSMHE